MSFQSTLILRMSLTILAFTAVGCGQGFKAGNNGTNDTTTESVKQPTVVDISEQLSKATEATKEAETAMADARVAIASISDAKGNIKINLFGRSSKSTDVQAQGLLKPLLAKLQPTFDRVYNKAVMVRDSFARARVMLITAMAKLDKSVPLQAEQIELIMQQVAQIDKLEMQFKNSMHTLATKLNLALNGLDKLVSMATSLIPIPFAGLAAGFVIDLLLVSDIREFIQTFQLKLLSI